MKPRACRVKPLAFLFSIILTPMGWVALAPNAQAQSNPGTVSNLSVASVTSSGVTLSFTQVNDGTGQPAKYDVRFAPGTINWGSAPSVTQGTCATPLTGTAIGATRTCTVTGLSTSTAYQFRLVAYRGTLNQGATFGGLSNVASATTSGSDTTPPTISITNPLNGATISGSVPISANASDSGGVAGVQFKRDGVNLGSEDTTAPYSVVWNTTSVANGAHTLTATARDVALNTKSASVDVTVSNAPPAAGRCGQLRASDPNIVLCEDFEDTGYVQGTALTSGHTWYDRWRAPAPSLGNCIGPGTCPNGKQSGFAILSEGNCLASGESDCVQDGNRSFGVFHVPNATGGRIGETPFARRVKQNVGFTYAVRFSPTFRPPDGSASTCGQEGVRAGYKPDRFFSVSGGSTTQDLLGLGSGAPGGCKSASGATSSAQSVNFPFGAGWDITSCGAPTQPCGPPLMTPALGSICRNDVHVSVFPDRAVYEWGRTHRPGQWMCVQFHYQNWGESNARVRYWVDGRLVSDITSVDMTDVRFGESVGVDHITLENYFNGCYNGPDLAMRYEDNIVVRDGAPVSCSAIGFAF